MNGLCVSLSGLNESRALEVCRTASEVDVRPEGAATLGARDITVDGVLTRIDTELFFQGDLSAKIDVCCDRCLSNTVRDVCQSVEWFFEPGEDSPVREAEHDVEVDAEDVDGTPVRYYAGDAVDLGPPAWEELVFSLPSKLLCMDECKGLCGVCGMNLNEGACACSQTKPAGHPGLAELKDLFPDLPETKEE